MIDPRHIEVGVDDWIGLYKESWTGVICPEAFAHPAKFSRALIRAIYLHCSEMNWIKPGDSVVDPFGGVALGGFDAMQLGLNWTGCELEEKFVGLGNQNIALWNDRYSRMPNWGAAVLLQGDSRKLANVIREARIAVSSPPYATGLANASEYADPAKADKDSGRDMRAKAGASADMCYGSSEGQLGAMKEGDLNLAISSPPYISGGHHPDQTGAWNTSEKYDGRNRGLTKDQAGYGDADGQMGRMKEGDHSIAITSPPYNPPMSQDHNGSRGGSRGTTPSENGAFVKYGNTPGQLEGLSMDGFDTAISSPPFPQPYTSGGGINVKGYGNGSDKVGERTYQSKGGDRSEGNLETMDDKGFQAAITSPPYEGSLDHAPGNKNWDQGPHYCGNIEQSAYSVERDNLGNQRGEDFWSASRLILEQLYQVIVPGGHAVFVVKAFVRNKQIVGFPAQWAQLCEAVGFRLVHHHRALLIEEYGEQHRLDGGSDVKTVARKSFFRRLAEAKGSPRIDHESVLCFEKC